VEDDVDVWHYTILRNDDDTHRDSVVIILMIFKIKYNESVYLLSLYHMCCVFCNSFWAGKRKN